MPSRASSPSRRQARPRCCCRQSRSSRPAAWRSIRRNRHCRTGPTPRLTTFRRRASTQRPTCWRSRAKYVLLCNRPAMVERPRPAGRTGATRVHCVARLRESYHCKAPHPAKIGMVRRFWDEFVDVVADHWRLAVLAIVALAIIAWLSPRTAQALATLYRHHRESYLASEILVVSAIARGGKTPGCQRDLHRAARLARAVRAPRAEADDLGSADGSRGSPPRRADRLDRERLFSSRVSPGDWSPPVLLRRVSVARRRLQRTILRGGAVRILHRILIPSDRHTSWGSTTARLLDK